MKHKLLMSIFIYMLVGSIQSFASNNFPLIDNKLFVTGKDLQGPSRKKIYNLITNNKDIVMHLDISCGGLVDNNGSMNITKNTIPANLHHLVVVDPKNLVSYIGPNFLAGHQNIVSCDLSNIKKLYYINPYFLYNCNNLKCVDISSLREQFNISYIGFLRDSPQIKTLNLPEFFLKHNNLRFERKIIEFARNLNLVNNKTLQLYSHNIINNYKKFKDTFIENINAQLFQINAKALKATTPQPLQDIESITNMDVINFFKKYLKELGADKEWQEYGSSKEISELQKVIENIFLNKKNEESWRWLNDKNNTKEIQIGIKHFINALKDRDINEIKSYLSIIYYAFEKCQTRKAMELNNILVALGIEGKSFISCKYNIIFEIINQIKIEAFEKLKRNPIFIKELSANKGSSHDYSIYMTILKNKFGFPMPLKNFNEKIKTISDNENLDILHQYLQYFNEQTLIDCMKQKINQLFIEENIIKELSFELNINKQKISQVMQNNRKKNRKKKKSKNGNQQIRLIKRNKEIKQIIESSLLTKFKTSPYIFRDIIYDFIKHGDGEVMSKFNQIRGAGTDTIKNYDDLATKPLNDNEVRYILEKLSILNTEYHKQIHGEESKILDIVVYTEPETHETATSINSTGIIGNLMKIINGPITALGYLYEIATDWVTRTTQSINR